MASAYNIRASGRSNFRGANFDPLSRLPTQLTEDEEELVNLVLSTASKARRTLPEGATLQEWIDLRMPGKVVLNTNAAGKIMLEPVQTPTPPEAVRPARPPRTVPPRIVKPPLHPCIPCIASPSDFHAFLASLPAECFTQSEERLRDAIIEVLRFGPIGWERVKQATSVRAAQTAALPNHVPLDEWIKNRIGAEIFLYMDDDLQHLMCALDDPEQGGARLPDGVRDHDEMDTPAREGRKKLDYVCRQILAGEMGEGDILYDTCEVEGGFQTSVRTPRLPGRFAHEIWFGDVCPGMRIAKSSAALRASDDILADPELGPSIDITDIELNLFTTSEDNKGSKRRRRILAEASEWSSR